jgi:predicted lysophospholipase L1 biosynthesis ABC-type transport system permease subunit
VRAARASTASVTAALHDVAGLGGFFAIQVGGRDDGRHPIARSCAAGFTDLAEAVARRHRASEPRVDVSIAQLGHAARLWSPALACVVLHGIVLDLEGLQRAAQAMETASRRREFALLRLTGSSRSQVRGTVRRESFTVAAVGGVLGTLLSGPPLALVALALAGEPWPTVPVPGWLAIVGSTARLAVAGAMLPTRLMLRAGPVDAIETKE